MEVVWPDELRLHRGVERVGHWICEVVDAPGGGGYVVRMVQPCRVPASADANTEPADARDVQIGAPPGKVCAIVV